MDISPQNIRSNHLRISPNIPSILLERETIRWTAKMEVKHEEPLCTHFSTVGRAMGKCATFVTLNMMPTTVKETKLPKHRSNHD